MEKFIVSPYFPANDTRNLNYPQTDADYARRTDKIRNGDFSDLRRELGPLNIIGAPQE